MAILHLVLRVSSEEQAQDGEKGFDVQLDTIVYFTDSISKYDGYERVVYPFTQSSTEPKFLSDRPDLLQILDNVKPGDVPCYFNMERLSRDGFVRSEFIQRLIHKRGITEIIVSNKIYDLTNESDLMMLGIYSSVTHKQTKEDLLRRIEAKRRHRDEGKFIGGMLPLGYGKNKEQDKHRDFVIDLKGADIYRRIVDKFLTGSSTSDVAIALNREGIPTGKASYGFKDKRITRWRSETVRYILRNPFYLGKVINGKQVIPALISEEKWQKIQEKLRNSASRPGPIGTKTLLLRDLLKCDKCGSRILGRTTFVKRKKKSDHWIKQYYCSNRWIEKEYKDERQYCKSPLIDMDVLDNLVWNRTVMYLLNVDELKKELQKPQDKDETPKIKERMAELQGEIKRLKFAKDDLLSMLGSGYWTRQEVENKVKEVSDRISEAEVEILLFQDRLQGEQRLTHTLLTLKEISQQLKRNLYNYTPEKKRELLLKVIKEIRIDWIDKDVYTETSRDCLSVDIKYVLDIKELRNYFGIMDAHLRSCRIWLLKRLWK